MKIRKDFLPFSRPSIGATEINKVVDCLKSGWITTGARCQEFEASFCQLTGAKQAITLNSATAGMHLILTALGIGAKDGSRDQETLRADAGAQMGDLDGRLRNLGWRFQ